MRLLRLYILNSGVFEKTVIDFTKNENSQNLICLSGVNGTGKTTIIELITNLMGLITPGIKGMEINQHKRNVLTYTDFAQLDMLFEGKIVSVVYGGDEYIQYHDSAKQVILVVDDIKSLIKKIEDFIKIQIEEFKENKSIIDSKIEEFAKSLISNPNKTIHKIVQYKIINEEAFPDFIERIDEYYNKKILRNDLEKLPFIYKFETLGRNIYDIRQSEIRKREFKYDLVHSYNPLEDDLNSLLVYYDYAYPELFNEIKEWINSEIFINKQLDRIERPDFKAIIKTNSGREHGLELLSSGEKNLLIIAIQLYLKASQNTIFLIDEIDQSLHPEFQSKLMKIIFNIQEKFNSQIIVSSHSRFIWDEFDENSIIRLTEMVK